MKTYGDLLFTMLNNSMRFGFSVQRINLAPPKNILDLVPVFFQSTLAHIWIWLSAILQRAKYKTDVIHITDGSYAYLVNLLRARVTLVTSHDVIPLLQTRQYFPVKSPGILAKWIIRQSIRGLQISDRVVSVSQHTKDDLVREANVDKEKIRVIPLPLSDTLCALTYALPHKNWIDRRKKADAYILHVGNSAFYKNRDGVIRVFSRIHDQMNVYLKMVGPPPGKNLLSLCRNLGVSRAVDFVVEPDDFLLADLYRSASLFLFPSHYEGFGWPPLEAMAFGCPVVCSDAASLPEVLGDAAIMCLAEDEEKMAMNALSVLNDQTTAEELISRGYEQVRKFSAEKMVQELRALYHEFKIGLQER